MTDRRISSALLDTGVVGPRNRLSFALLVLAFALTGAIWGNRAFQLHLESGDSTPAAGREQAGLPERHGRFVMTGVAIALGAMPPLLLLLAVRDPGTGRRKVPEPQCQSLLLAVTASGVAVGSGFLGGGLPDWSGFIPWGVWVLPAGALLGVAAARSSYGPPPPEPPAPGAPPRRWMSPRPGRWRPLLLALCLATGLWRVSIAPFDAAEISMLLVAAASVRMLLVPRWALSVRDFGWRGIARLSAHLDLPIVIGLLAGMLAQDAHVATETLAAGLALSAGAELVVLLLLRDHVAGWRSALVAALLMLLVASEAYWKVHPGFESIDPDRMICMALTGGVEGLPVGPPLPVLPPSPRPMAPGSRESRVVILGGSPLASPSPEEPPEADSLAANLEELLETARAGRSIRVVDQTFGGCSSALGLELLERRFLKVSRLAPGSPPDLLIVCFGFNDGATPWPEKGRHGRMLRQERWVEQRPWLGSARVRLWHSGWFWTSMAWAVPLLERVAPRSDAPSVSLAEFRDNLRAFALLAKAHEFSVTYATEPRPHLVDASCELATGLEEHHVREMRRLGGEMEVPVLESAPAFCGKDLALEDCFANDIHLTPNGRRLLAEEWARQIRERGLLP